MKISKVLFLMILYFLLILHLQAQANVQLNEQMKTLRGRLRAYSKCSRGKCTHEERTIIAKKAMGDAIWLLTLLVSGTLVIKVIKVGKSNNIKKIISDIANIESDKIIFIGTWPYIGEVKVEVSKKSGGINRQDIITLSVQKNSLFRGPHYIYPELQAVVDELKKDKKLKSIHVHLNEKNQTYSWIKDLEGNWGEPIVKDTVLL